MEQKDQPTTLAELEALAEHWQGERQHAGEYLSHLEAASFKALLEGRQVEHSRLVHEARATVSMADSILAEIERQLPTAKALSAKKLAAKRRQEAGRLIKEAKELEAQIEPLLAEIEAIQGCRYVPPARLGPYSPATARSEELRQQAGRLLENADFLEINASETLREIEERQAKQAARIRTDREQVTQWA